MKVLKPAAKNPKKWKIKATCTGKGWLQTASPCGCLLEVEGADLFCRKYTDMSGETDLYYGFVCCECGCFTELDETEIPAEVKAMAKDWPS